MTSETVSRFGGALSFLEPLLITAAVAALLAPAAMFGAPQAALHLFVLQLLATLAMLAAAFAVSVAGAAARLGAARKAAQPACSSSARPTAQRAACLVGASSAPA